MEQIDMINFFKIHGCCCESHTTRIMEILVLTYLRQAEQDHFVITTVGILASSPSLLHSSAPYDIKASLIGGDMPKPGQNKQLF